MRQILNIIKKTKRTICVEYNGVKHKLNKFGVMFTWNDKWQDYRIDWDNPYGVTRRIQDEIQNLLVKSGATYTYDKGDRLYNYSQVTDYYEYALFHLVDGTLYQRYDKTIVQLQDVK